MKNKHILFALVATLFITSCGKDNEEIVPAALPPQVQLSVKDDKILINSGDELIITAVSADDKEVTHQWILNGAVVNTTNEFVFNSTDKGPHELVYKATNSVGEFTKTYTIEVLYDFNNPYVTRLLEYKPAPGQFLNKAPGNLASAEGILGKKGLVTLGAYGGYIVLGFDHSVINRQENDDLIIYNNASASLAEPGIVYVMKDDNKNGLADDTWYEIAGSEFNKPGFDRNYAVTYTRPNPVTADVPWTDNKGNSGVVKTNTFHKQAYYPEWITENSYTLTGSLLPSTGINMTNPSFITSAPFAAGYADNTAGGDKIDIANAVDANGNKVNLRAIDFIKIQTGLQANMGWLGELSTEVLGVADLSLVK